MKKIFFLVFLTILFSCFSKNNLTKLPKNEIQKNYVSKISNNNKYISQWWKSFNNEELNNLIDKAIKNNFDINIAVKNLKKVELIYEGEKTKLLPEFFLNLQFEKDIIKKKKQEKIYSHIYSLGTSTSYEVDVWGKIRQEINIAKLDILEKKYIYDSVLITISGEVAKNWLNILYLKEKEKLLKQILELRKLEDFLLKNKYLSNQVNIDEIIINQQQILKTKNELIKIKYEKQISKNIIKQLLGLKNDEKLEIHSRKLPEILLPLDIGTPMAIVEFRPDVKISRVKLLKSLSNYKISSIEDYPKLTLSVNHIYSSTDLSNIFKNWTVSFFKNILYPLVDYHKRKKIKFANRIEIEKNFLNYKKNLYNAIKEIENIFLELKENREILQNIDKSIIKESEKNRYLTLKYKAGQRNLLNILESKISLFFYKINFIDYKLFYLENIINLYKAVGGNYNINKSRGKNG